MAGISVQKHSESKSESVAAYVAAKYKGEAAVEVARELAFAARTYDRDAVEKIAQCLSADEVIRAVGRYEGSAAVKVAQRLANTARILKDKGAIEKIAQVVGGYDDEAAVEVAGWLAYAARDLKDKDAVERVVQCLSADEVIQTVGRYESYTAAAVAQGLAYVAVNLKDKDAVEKIAQCLSADEVIQTVGRYEGEVAAKVAQGLAHVARDFKDKDVVERIAQVVGRYEGEVAAKVARGLAYAAQDLKDAAMMTRYMNMLDTVNGMGMIDKIDTKQGVAIVKEGLDTFVTGRKQMYACLAYVNSNCRLPKPTAENMGSYQSVANDFVSREYGITVPLSLDHIGLLFSLDADISRRAIEFINASSVQNERVYTINGGMRAAGFESDAEKTPEEKKRLAIIAIVGSNDPQRFEEAQKYIGAVVGYKTANAAFISFNGTCKKEHPGLKADVIRLFNEGDYDGVFAALRKTGIEAISDVTYAAEGVRSLGPAALGSRKIYAYETKNPLEYDSRVLLACTCINGIYAEKGMLNYCKDQNVILVAYSFGGQACASAICYVEGTTFLVDSVEGRERIRNDAFFGVVRKDIEERARLHGADTIIFSKDAGNKTPNEFLEFLRREGAAEGRVKMMLNTESYLEARRGRVNGYLSKT